ncbi:YfgM family protein [Saccharospirillum mangrovi]|uniref:YfgM family protein n=1 Tax=Saccharospirillum mangrovi TaxID=2161747 RepID=UPI000D388BD5|nr:tetratricopeptide repeat protein [Saccharospirillum mangrovi]
MYDTEQEQIEAIKKWWSLYGNYLIGGVLVALVAFFSWTFYKNAVQSKLEAASALYDDLMSAVENDDIDTVNARIDNLKSDYSDTVYGVYAGLQAAKQAVDGGDLVTAAQELEWALDNADDSLVPVVRLRLARVHVAASNYEAALAQLDAIDQDGFEVPSLELRGDILLAQGDADAARAAYEAAFEEAGQQGVNSPYLEMKLNDLAIETDAG